MPRSVRSLTIRNIESELLRAAADHSGPASAEGIARHCARPDNVLTLPTPAFFCRRARKYSAILHAFVGPLSAAQNSSRTEKIALSFGSSKAASAEEIHHR